MKLQGIQWVAVATGKEALAYASFGVDVKLCLYCLNKAKFGQSILSKIFKIVASRCQKMHKMLTMGLRPSPREGNLLPQIP